MTDAHPRTAPPSLRIEMAVPTLVRAGMETVVAQLASRLTRRGHRVGVTCTEALGPLADTLVHQGIPVRLTPCPGVLTLLHAPGLAASWRTGDIDIVHVHNGVWLKGARAARAAGIRVVVNTCHGLEDPEPWYDPLMMRLATRSTDHVVAVSTVLSQYLRDDVRLPASRVGVIMNGVDVDLFAPGRRDAQWRRQFGIGAGTFLIGLVARLSPIKNPSLLVRALALIPPGEREVNVVYIGGGDMRREVAEVANTLGVSSRVHFAGEVADMATVYRELDALALTSWNEGTPMCLLEGMASGAPIIATHVGGVPALLDDGHLGVLVPPGNPQLLAQALTEMLQRPEAGIATAARARTAACERYSIEATVDRYEALYRSLGAGAPFRSVR